MSTETVGLVEKWRIEAKKRYHADTPATNLVGAFLEMCADELDERDRLLREMVAHLKTMPYKGPLWMIGDEIESIIGKECPKENSATT